VRIEIASTTPLWSLLEIGSGEDAPHPRHCAGGRGVVAFDLRMSIRRTQHDAVQLTGQVYVIDITRLPGQKPRVFEAAQRTPDMAPVHQPALKPCAGHYDAVSRARDESLSPASA
jgi:hypothetical protein